MGDFYPAAKNGGPDLTTEKREVRALQFRIAPADPGQAMIVLEQGRETIAYAKNVTYCSSQESVALTPSADGTGLILAHVVGNMGDYDRQRVHVVMNRYYGQLAQYAEVGKC